MTSTATTGGRVEIPDYVAGTWAIDTSHSDVSFSVRHLMVSKVRGRFSSFTGEIVTAEDPLASQVTASVDLTSIDTNNEQRDEHIRSADFFDVEHHPVMSFRSTGLHAKGGDRFVLDGELSLHGVTREVSFDLELNGFNGDPWGGTRVGFSATTEISRRDYGIDTNIPMDGGGVVIGDRISVLLEVEAVLQPSA